jgi:SAM-dependent methyltransferase
MGDNTSTTPVVTPDRIFQVGAGFMASKYLLTANELGIFAALAEGPLTLEALAIRTGVPSRTLRIVADALTALGFLAKMEERYTNGPDAQAFLSGKGPADVRPILRFWNRQSFAQWVKLDQAIRENTAARAGEAPSAEDNLVLSEGVEALTAREAAMLPAAFDFGSRKRVLNIGGWYVSFLLPLLDKYPHLSATLFMLPQWRERAELLLERSTSAKERVTLEDGDYLFDPLPPDHDVVLLAHLLHHMSPEHIKGFLGHVHRNLKPGAVVIAIDYFTNEEHTQPLLGALLAGQFHLLSGEGDVYSVDEAKAWFSDGYQNVRHAPLFGASSMLIAEVI